MDWLILRLLEDASLTAEIRLFTYSVKRRGEIIMNWRQIRLFTR
jgi:hypothetical protein